MSFQSPLKVLLYLIALFTGNAPFPRHLEHVQTLGINTKRTTPMLRMVALVLAVLVPLISHPFQ